MNIEKGFTAEDIKRRTGFVLQFQLASFTDPACMAGYHDEHERMARDYGSENIIGTLYVEEGALMLGVFMKYIQTIDGELVRPELEAASPQIEPREQLPRIITA